MLKINNGCEVQVLRGSYNVFMSIACYLQKYFFFVSENSIPTKKAWFGNIFIKKWMLGIYFFLYVYKYFHISVCIKDVICTFFSLLIFLMRINIPSFQTSTTMVFIYRELHIKPKGKNYWHSEYISIWSIF